MTSSENRHIRYGKSKGGLVGLTLSQEQVAKWVLSQHICNFLSLKMDEVFVSDMGEVTRQYKEEGERRRQIVAEDRSKICKEIVECHHPLQTSALKIINISNGYVANEKVNVENAVFIGNKMKTEFQNGLPEVFHKPVHVQVYTMESMKHGVKIFSHELAPLPSFYLMNMVF